MSHFFPLNDSQKAAAQLMDLYRNEKLRNQYVEQAYHFVTEEYNQKKYIQQLIAIYSIAAHLNLN